jgi:aspartate dehydrogenase
MSRLKIGIVGCGAIGSSLARVIAKDFSGRAKLAALYDVDNLKSKTLAKKFRNKSLVANSLKDLIDRSELVVEAASSKYSWGVAKNALRQGRDIMLMSVGGLISKYNQLNKLARLNNRRVYIPSGAISGIDALKAARIGGVISATLTTIKNPLSFKGVKYIEERGIDLSKIKKDKVLFSGPASRAVKLFPQNINVAAVLSLSGIGPDKTRVKIIASPKVSKNIHEIRIESQAGNIFTHTENVLHPDNPKTSYLAVLSASAVLKQILEPVRIGT